uniref:Uncharacterized protein n=1 Tax=Manihot esculenta TaxID=3983 RepID=A0A2C9URH7_MANES
MTWRNLLLWVGNFDTLLNIPTSRLIEITTVQGNIVKKENWQQIVWCNQFRIHILMLVS